jgi:hypothetical protein
MNRAGMILVAAAILAATSTSSEARHYRHSGCYFVPPHDYGPNNLSPLTYVFPAADWGPFFYCRMYQSRIQPLPDRY